MSTEFVYGLYFTYNDEKFYFYVGRSGRGVHREPGVRFKEHQYHATYDTTQVYTFIREQLNAYNVDWYEDVLCWCSDDEATVNDTEMFWVIKMILDGHDLKNAKHGDAKKYVEAKAAISSGYTIESPKDVAGWRVFNANRKRQLAEEIRAMAAGIKKEAENGCLDNRINVKDLLSKLKIAESVPEKRVTVVYSERAQEAFDCGKYALALSYLGKSTIRFAEQFGITYHECV